MAKFTAQNQYEKVFFSAFESLCYTRDSWRVWSDFIFASAITLSNTFEPFPERKAEREKEYKDCIERLGGVEKPAKLLKIVVMALEEKTGPGFPRRIVYQAQMFRIILKGFVKLLSMADDGV